MGETKIQVGQVWKHIESGKNYLVTRLFTEALATFAVLRDTNDDKAKPLRVKVARTAKGATLPGYVPAQSSEVS